MCRELLLLVMSAALGTPAAAATLTLAGLADDEDGRAVDLDGQLAVTPAWSVGAGLGHAKSALEGDRFSATGLRLSTDVQFGGAFVTAAAERWQDSGRLEAVTLRGELGWMSESGVAISALVVDRSLDITYTAVILGVPREFDVNLDGTGFGGDLSYLGETWSAGVRYLDYDYGRNVDRVRTILESTNITRFPRLQRLFTSVATRAAGAPDREAGAVLSRQFGGGYLSVDWQQQRDAVTHEKTKGLGVTLGLDLGPRWLLDVMAGVSKGGSQGKVSWGGLALTLRTAPQIP